MTGSTIDYDGPSKIAVIAVHPPERVEPLSHPFQSQSLQSVLSQPACLFELANIDFWARYGGSIVTADNKLLADLSPEVWAVENHPIFSQLRLPASRPLPGQTAIAVTPEAPGNYYHWLVDLLPRLCLIKNSRSGFGSFAQILINGTQAPYEQASLSALQIPRDKISYVDANDRFCIENALIPSMDHSSPVIAPWKIDALRALRDAMPGPVKIAPRRIYVSRRRAAVRRIINEAELEAILRPAGFVSIELEALPWPEQVALFSNAEIVLAPHGAALANIVFCAPNAFVAEIATRAGYKEFYLRLAASAALRYRFVEATPETVAPGSLHRAVENDDMIVDLEMVRALLREP